MENTNNNNNVNNIKNLERKAQGTLTKILNADKQRLTTYFAYFAVIAISIISATLSVVFDIEHFDQAKFITNLAFNAAIAILGMILSWRDGELSNRSRKRGELYEARNKFDRLVKTVVDTDSFSQWSDILYEKKRKSYIMNLLTRIGIYDYEYLLINDNDFDRLLKEPIINAKYLIKGEEHTISLDQITKMQYDELKKMRSTKIKYEKLPFYFFLSRETIDEYQTYANEQENNKKQKVFALVYRTGSLLIFSAIIAFSVVNPQETNATQVVFDTMGRVFQLITSLFMGYSIAHDEGIREKQCLDYKCQLIEDYNNDILTGLFVAKNRDEIIQQKIMQLRNQRISENKVQIGVSSVNDSENEKQATNDLKNAKIETEIITMTEEEYNKYIEKEKSTD